MQIADLNEDLENAKVASSGSSAQDDEIETRASNLDMEELDEAKRLMEVENFKLQEKREKLDEAQHSSDQDCEKKQREIEVYRKEAEIILREL